MIETLSREDSVNWRAHARVDKYSKRRLDLCQNALSLDHEPISHELFAFFGPSRDFAISEGNLLTRLGLHRMWDRFIGTASNQALDATHMRIGVGDTATAATTSDTDLGAAAGSTHRQFNLVDAVATIGSAGNSGILTIVSTFGTTLANFAWAEWGIDGGTAQGTTVTSDANTTPGLINHKISSLGTKTSAASWIFTVTITLA